MTLLVLSFLAGVLTVAAPCVFTLLPVIVGGSLARSDPSDASRNLRRPLIIALSLVGSIVIFTLLLKVTTSLLGVPTYVWQFLAGGIIILLGVSLLKPSLWEFIALKTGLHLASNKFLGESTTKSGVIGDVMTGAALGPVFASCSPTYAFLVASIIPASFVEGLVYLLAYSIGLGGVLLIVSYAGQGAVQKLGWLKDPEGKFRKAIGIIFIIVGLAVFTGFEKKFETWLLDSGWYSSIGQLEENLRN